MRLNNKGFGISNLIIVIVLFVVAIIAVSILSYKAGIEKGSPKLDDYEWTNVNE